MTIKKNIVEMIAHWSRTFGLPVNRTITIPTEEEIAFDLSLIKEEIEELEEAIKNKDLVETQDALGDILWVTIRKMMRYGMSPEKTIEAIYLSNMSKVDIDEPNALITKKKYDDLQIETCYKNVDGLFVTYRKSDNKVLKSHRFKEPEFKN